MQYGKTWRSILTFQKCFFPKHKDLKTGTMKFLSVAVTVGFIAESAAYNTDPSILKAPIHTLLLCRHGDSVWNGGEPGTHEIFTGWTDVALSNKGKAEAAFAAEQLAKYATFGIDACFMSSLKRAQDTANFCLNQLPSKPKTYVDFRLNERHYGSLQGYIKKEVEAGKYGHNEDDVEAWRRSWFAVPPLLDDDDPRRIEDLEKYSNHCGGEHNVPRGESLELVAKNRIRPFLDDLLTPVMDQLFQAKVSPDKEVTGSTGLVVAHANSLRALIGIICEVEDDPVALEVLESLRLPTGVPLVLKFRQKQAGHFEVCDLPEAEECVLEYVDGPGLAMEPPPDLGHPKLPVWPLNSCIPVNDILQGSLRAEQLKADIFTRDKILCEP